MKQLYQPVISKKYERVGYFIKTKHTHETFKH